MQWMQPWAFLWGAVVIPAIIFFYLLKRRYTEQTISSTLLWQRVLQQREVTRPWQKLHSHLLFLLQMSVAGLLIVALARPAVPVEGLTTNHTVLLIDTSGSMLTEEHDGVSRLTLAKEKAIALIDTLQRGQEMTIVEIGSPPRVVVASTGEKNALKAGIESLDVAYLPGDREQSLSFARALAARHGNGEVVLISDGSGWELSPELAPERTIVVGERTENVSIARFSAVTSGTSVKALVRLENSGTEPAQGALWLYDDRQRVLDTRAVRVEPGKIETVMWENLYPAPYYYVTLDVEEDALTVDNESWTIPTTPVQQDVLFIGAGNDFLEKALRLNDRINIVKLADMQEVEQQTAAYPFFIYDETGTSLPENGNALMIYPPDNFAGLNWGNEVQLKEPIQQLPHPIVDHVSFEDVYIVQARAVEPPAGWEVIVRSGNVPLVLVREEGHQRLVLLTFDLKQSDLPLTPEFPVFVHQLVNWLLPQESSALTEGKIGDPTVMLLGGDVEHVTVTAPSGEQQTIEPRQLHMTYTPKEVGLYEVKIDGQSGSTLRHFVVPFPAEETEIRPDANFTTATTESEMAQNRSTHAWSEIGKWVAFAALLFLTLEWVVYARGY